ncbi:MAG: hypothetical protein ACKOEM_09625, partial [Planctomycetia bacterium]
DYLCWPSLHVTPPTITPHTMQAWLRAARPYVSGVFINSFYREVSPFEFLMYRIWMRLLWNPDLDVDAEIADVCDRFFGPAGDTMREFHEQLVARCERPWDRPELLESKFYATPDLYYGQSFPPDRIRELAALLERARAEAGLPAVLTSTVVNGSAIHLYNKEPVPVPVEITLAAGRGEEIVNPVVIWDEGRVAYEGRIRPDEQLVVAANGAARLVDTKTHVSREVPVTRTGLPAAISAEGAAVFHFQHGGPAVATLTYGIPGEATAVPDDIHARRLEWFRKPYQVFHPTYVYGMVGQAFTGFFAEAHMAHRHLGKVPTCHATSVATLPSVAKDPVWETAEGVDLVRGRQTPKDQICRWSYLSRNNVLPFNNFGFPAGQQTTVRCLHAPKGLAVRLDAGGAPVAGESLALQVDGRTFEFAVDPREDKPPFLEQLDVDGKGWHAVVVLGWAELGVQPAPGHILPFQVQRVRGDDSSIWSPPLGSIWGHCQQGPGKLVIAF